MIYFQLFLDFFKVSCFTFGGAYGAIPLIRDMVLSNGWIAEDELSYMIAVSESTPGPILVNLATYIGSSLAGFWGSVTATVAVVLPAYLVIMLVVGILRHALENKYVQAVLQGVKPCVAGVVLGTGCCMVLGNCVTASAIDIRAVIITAVLAAAIPLYKLVTKKKLSPIALICMSACLGIILYA